MMKPQAEIVREMEDLVQKRLDLLKEYHTLSAVAMQCLEKNDTEELGRILDKRGALTAKVDALNAAIDSLVSLADEGCRGVIASLVMPGQHDSPCPEWGADIARSMKRTDRLLQDCVLFDARIISRAKAAQMEIQNQLGRVHAQRRIRSAYADKGASPNGTHIHYNTK